MQWNATVGRKDKDPNAVFLRYFANMKVSDHAGTSIAPAWGNLVVNGPYKLAGQHTVSALEASLLFA